MTQKICEYGPRSGRPDTEKVRSCDEVTSEWDFGSSTEIIISSGVFSGHVEKCAEGIEGGLGEIVSGKEKRKKDCWSSVMKKSCAWQTHSFIRQTIHL